MSGLMGSVFHGAALGTGSAVAHRAVDSMMGPRDLQVTHENAPAPVSAAAAAPMHYSSPGAQDPCGERVKEFTDCMSRTNGDMSACTFYFDSMQACKASVPQNRFA